MRGFSFSVENTERRARQGRFVTPHGAVETPAFMPVGTHGAVRGLTMDELRDAGATMVLANAYHLSLRPGDSIIRDYGGIHAFARWRGPMLTDSGGYQVFSLSRYRKVTEDGVEFRSKLDGARHHFTPERVMQIERNIGADVIMQFDELVAGGADYNTARAAMERSLRWLERCRAEFERLENEAQYGMQTLFPIVQGGTWRELRIASIQGILSTGTWDGVAIGGLSVGESKDSMYDTFEICEPQLPEDKPRYLMGVGFPDDLLEAVARGMDLFDCVAPTRMGRHGTVFTRDGKIQIQKSSNRANRGPISESCACVACRDYDRAYLRHLMAVEEPLGPRLLALHNLTFILDLMKETREAIRAGRFASWSSDWLLRYRRGRRAVE